MYSLVVQCLVLVNWGAGEKAGMKGDFKTRSRCVQNFIFPHFTTSEIQLEAEKMSIRPDTFIR